MKASIVGLVSILDLQFHPGQQSDYSIKIDYVPATYSPSHYDQTTQRSAFVNFSLPPLAIPKAHV